MTTIVFNEKTQEIACDSRATNTNGLIITNHANKAMEHGEETWFMAGTVADMKEFMDAEVGEVMPFQLECHAFVIRPEGMFVVYTDEDCRVRTTPLLYTEAIGSGGDWALAGLDLGLDIRASVEYAMTKDCFSGGAVQVYNKDGIIEPDNSIEQEAHDAN